MIVSPIRSMLFQSTMGLLLTAGLGITLPALAQTQGAAPSAEITPPEQLQDCGSDEACLLKNAGVCRPAQAEITRSLEMMGIVTNSPTQVQIWGPQGQGCVLHVQSLSSQEGFSSIMTEELQEAGLSNSMMEILQRNRVLTTCWFTSSISLSQFLQIVTEQQQGSVDMFNADPTNSTTRLLVNGSQSATCQVQRAS